MAYGMNEFHGNSEFLNEVFDAGIEALELQADDIAEIAADFLTDTQAPPEEVESLTEDELIDRAIDRGILSPAQVNDGDYDTVLLGEKLGLNHVHDENGDPLWLGWKVIQR
jgi:hypothetical protein